jgi:hypothetical protein
MTGEFKSCLDCTFYRALREADPSQPVFQVGRVVGHLCHLPPECAPPLPEGAEGDPHYDWERDHEDREYLGTLCDVMRRMGATCGPRAAMWTAKESEPAA